MSENKTKKQALDEFWDISALVPPTRRMRPVSKSVSTVEITEGADAAEQAHTRLTKENTVIQRFIPPHSASELERKAQPTEIYTPDNSLIHKVSLYKEQTSYEFYADFCSTAKQLWNADGAECEYAEFFSYSPQYNQLSSSQLAYYLWWRKNLREGIYLKTNLCYIYLYAFELINAGESKSAEQNRSQLIAVLDNYSDVIKGAAPRYIRWISDYSLIHKLPPPKSFPERLLASAGTLKEYFVRIAGNTPEGWARALLEYCCSYDYKTSKFAVGENLALYDKHIHGALTDVVKKLSVDGRILSALPFDDCKIIAKAYEGAVCSSNNRYTLEVEYCSFSRSHELRFLVGDVVKYAENKIRGHIAIKSRLTVYSLPNDLRDVIDEYFKRELPHPRKTLKKEQAPAEYDVLYDLPKKKLDISNADKIERESWDTTRELIQAFEEQNEQEETLIAVEEIQNTEEKPQTNDESLISALGEYAKAVIALKNGNSDELKTLATSARKPLEAIVDAVNEIAVEIIGDIIIEESSGGYALIEDYADMLD